MDRADLAMAVSGAPHVLVVAGSDSSGGAGLARDVETISAFGLRTCLAVTAVTVQTHVGVDRIEPMPANLIAEQMRAAFAANAIRAIKIGMLGAEEAIAAMAAVLRLHRQVPAVLDPVLAASSGRALLPDTAIGAMKHELMPLCALVTPNLIELAILTGSEPASHEPATLRQGHMLLKAGCNAVLVKGGHAGGVEAADLLLRPDQVPMRFAAPRLAGTMRGTGCMLASAIAAHLAAEGEMDSVDEAVRQAKRYVFERYAAATTPGDNNVLPQRNPSEGGHLT
ncbi:hydroxymethylpyrimidine/phosphomethylpyrimidine kinase [Pseudaminobacter sp. NGMCC 1.201702]|uniref:hydroxymethylpyrimidine/phosphomethylpyrimidine kinase n=1 Tax=Pseudaminobacter sp. NGMCC 1.201702 TaxID=3391825 RepID=UPI0039EE8F25